MIDPQAGQAGVRPTHRGVPNMMEASLSTVSVVIPTNGRSTLAASAESALQQTRQADSVTVVYDGDVADLPGIRRRLPGEVHLVATGIASNANVARSLGIQESSGRLIALLDDDDLWMPHKIELQASAMERRDADLVVSGTRYQLAGKFEGEVWPARGPFPGEAYGDYLFERRSIRRLPTGFQTSTIMATRASFERIPLDQTRRVHQDWDWLIRVSSQLDASVFLIDDVLSVYQNGGTTRKPSLSGSTAWRESYDWVMNSELPLSPRARGDFLLTNALNRAAETASFGAVLELVRSAYRNASPGIPASILAIPRLMRAAFRRSQSAVETP